MLPGPKTLFTPRTCHGAQHSRPCPFAGLNTHTRLKVFNYSNKFRDPYAILGLEGHADEVEVKKAYRKLAKKFHPDVAKEEESEAAHLHFVNITEAYEFLLQVLRTRKEGGSNAHKSGNSDAFHDWYWSFRMSRNYERQKARGEGQDAGPSQHAAKPQDAEGLRSQLAGLRHRAAIRRNRPATAAATDSAEMAHSEPLSEQGFAVAEGPSDSADPPLAAQTVAAHPDSPLDAAVPAADAHTTTEVPPPRRKFVANSEARDTLKSQLHGMRRKAHIRQRFQENPAV